MADLHRIASLVATDPDFRNALLDDPEAALARQGMQASGEELSALTRIVHLLACSPGDLYERFMATPDRPLPWQVEAAVSEAENGCIAAQPG